MCNPVSLVRLLFLGQMKMDLPNNILVAVKKQFMFKAGVTNVGSTGHFWPARTFGMARKGFLERSKRKNDQISC